MLICPYRRAGPMEPEYVEGNFLGLPETGDDVDVVVLSLPYELTTSYGQGTAEGPAACIESSAQVELYDPLLPQDLPCGLSIHTHHPWDGEEGTLLQQLDSMTGYLIPWLTGDCFPLVLGGEHGILPAIMQAQSVPLEELTVVQLDAHADLRSHLDGEKWSHACAAARALDLGLGALLQIGIRAYCREEAERMESDSRVNSFLARDLLNPCEGQTAWMGCMEALRELSGPVHLSIDIDGMDGTLVPDTGTPVPGGLQMWHAVEIIEALFSNPSVRVVSADVNEIVPGRESPLTQFTAAMLSTKVIAGHAKARQEGLWQSSHKGGKVRLPVDCSFFSSIE